MDVGWQKVAIMSAVVTVAEVRLWPMVRHVQEPRLDTHILARLFLTTCRRRGDPVASAETFFGLYTPDSWKFTVPQLGRSALPVPAHRSCRNTYLVRSWVEEWIHYMGYAACTACLGISC